MIFHYMGYMVLSKKRIYISRKAKKSVYVDRYKMSVSSWRQKSKGGIETY